MDRKLAAVLGVTARAARERAGLTQADVAEQIGIAPEVYGRLERGTMLPSVPTLKRICATLRISADVLLGLDAMATPPAAGWAGASEPRELRRLIRRASRLDRKRMRLLALLANALSD